MSDWIEKVLAEWYFAGSDEKQSDATRAAIIAELRQAYAAHCQSLDVNGLAERIAEACGKGIAATMFKQSPVRDVASANWTKTMLEIVRPLIAPLLAENERLRAELSTRTQQRDDQDRMRGEFAKRCVEAEAESERRLKLLMDCRDVMQSFAFCSLVPPTMEKVVPGLLTRIDQLTAKGAGQ